MDKGSDHKWLLSDYQSCEFDYIKEIKAEWLSPVLQKNSSMNTQFATNKLQSPFSQQNEISW